MTVIFPWLSMPPLGPLPVFVLFAIVLSMIVIVPPL
jgi:hypothetical protein